MTRCRGSLNHRERVKSEFCVFLFAEFVSRKSSDDILAFGRSAYRHRADP